MLTAWVSACHPDLLVALLSYLKILVLDQQVVFPILADQENTESLLIVSGW
jgi:hypothetical protein